MCAKQPFILINISESYISDIFWTFISKFTDNSCGYLHSLLLPHSNKCFFICLVPYIYICLYFFLILCYYIHLLFLTLLSTRHILQFTMFDSISLQPARKGAYIKYVGGGSRGVLQIFQKIFCSPGDHRPKYFMAQ